MVSGFHLCSRVPALRCSWVLLIACLTMLVSMPAGASEQKQADGNGGLVAFDIPAQPLASALETYSAISGTEVFYDAALAAGHRSTPVKGLFSRERGLEVLLRGTGYGPRTTGAGIVSVAPASRDLAQLDMGLRQSFHRYDYYFAALQARLSHALCNSDRAPVRSSEMIFRFWLSKSGEATRADLIASGGDPDEDRALVSAIEGLALNQPPPADLPEPITMAIFPPSAEERAECLVNRHREAGR